MKLIAGYDPATQRKGKFGLNLQMTRGELNQLKKRPFFALYQEKYNSKIRVPNLIFAKVLQYIAKDTFNFSYASKLKQNGLFGNREVRANNIARMAANTRLVKGSEEEGFKLYLTTFLGDFNGLALQKAIDSTFKVPYVDYKREDSEEVRKQKTEENDRLNSLGPQLYTKLNSLFGESVLLRINPEDIISQARADEKLALSSIKECFLIKQVSTIRLDIMLNLTAEDAKAFTGITTYAAIRNIDIYPVFLTWVQDGFKNGPVTSVAMSRISSALSPESTSYAKTNEHNLVLSAKGNLYLLPKVCDNTREYENSYIQACLDDENPDSFCISNMKKTGRHLKANLPVLVDWTNNKFVYSNTRGFLNTIDLSQCRTATKSHVLNVLRRRVLDREQDIKRYLEYVDVTTLSPNNYLTVMDEFEAGAKALGKNVTLYDACTDPLFENLKRLLCDLGASLERVPDRFYAKYSVLGGVEQIGLLSAIYHYMSDDVLEQTMEDDAENRAAAENQNVDPDWKLPSIPLLNPMIKAMPHQYRVLNRLKDNPNYALLPVAAGGGKTPLAIMEILYQYKSGRNAPYLVLCPSMLVSQYVQEVSFFTNAQLNVIPITSKVVKREGFERLQKIFEAAPRNTVVVCAYNALSYQAYKIAYGVTSIDRFPVVEFLRQFGFGFALCDESHQLKNEGTTRTRAVRSLLADIPVLRLASGTMAYNMVADLVSQTGIMDPSIFGSVTEFNARYGQWARLQNPNGKRTGVRLMGLRPGTETEVNRLLRQNVVVAGAARKEWAALLPLPETRHHFVQLPEDQLEFYNQFVQEAIEEIAQSKAYQRGQEKLAEMRRKLEAGEIDQQQLDEFEDKLTADLRPYLQKIERFLLDPNSVMPVFSEAGSAKAKTVCEIIIDHLNLDEVKEAVKEFPNSNKVIVFTENTISAEAIFECAKQYPELKDTGLLYKASEKAVALNEFNKNEKIRWMVGVEQSINTGLNLQAASRIIRAEYPWTPGAIEQGDARILRPNKNGKDIRKKVFFDWVICDGTIDSLKISRLMGKQVQIARFENPGDVRYEELGQDYNADGERVTTTPIINVSLDRIADAPRFFEETHDATVPPMESTLFPYYEAMKKLESLRVETFKEYREHHQDELNPDGTMKEVPFVVEATPKGAKLLANTPYVEGTNLYKADDLGLQRLDDYLRQFAKDEDEYQKQFNSDEDAALDDTPAELDEIKAPESPMAAAIESLKDQSCWTEYGECVFVSISENTNRCNVRPINTNEYITLTKDSVFVITRSEIDPRQIQSNILQSVGFKEISVPEYVTPAEQKEIGKRGRKLDPEALKQREEERRQRELADLTIPIQVAVINGILCLRYEAERGHDLAINLLQDAGFTMATRVTYARIKNKRVLDGLLELASSLGYRTGANQYDYANAWLEIGRLMKKFTPRGGEEDPTFVGRERIVTRLITDFSITNILREQQRRTTAPTLLRMYPMFISGLVYAVMPPSTVYPHGRLLRNATAQNEATASMKWIRTPKLGVYELYMEDRNEAQATVLRLKESGLNISNFDEVMAQLDKVVTRQFNPSRKLKKKMPSDSEGGKKKLRRTL